MPDITLNQFNSKVKRLEFGKAIERNNFNLVRDYLKGNIFPNEDCDFPYCTEEEFFDKNINEIKETIISKPYRKETKEALNDRLSILKNEYMEFKDYYYLNQRDNLDKQEKKFFQASKNRILYLTIELRAYLGLDLSDFYHEDIKDYCDALIEDLINNKYQRLNFSSHLDNNGNVIKLK